MKKYLQEYLLELSGSGDGFDFSSFACSYGEFTMYSLIGPEENIIQVTFAQAKHEQLKGQLLSLNSKVRLRNLQQHDFPFNGMFADYFTGALTAFPVSLKIPLLEAGTDFQKRIWRHIGAIPYGSSITYRELAQLAGSHAGARAAGMACGANPAALIIPCHRVVAENGLGGFAGGAAIKKDLLALERTVTALEEEDERKN